MMQSISSRWLMPLLLVTVTAGAQSSSSNNLRCMVVEQTRMAGKLCVPSNNEVCHSGQPKNCEIEQMTIECKLWAATSVYKKPVDSNMDNFDCITPADPVCEMVGDTRVCTREGPCKVYRAPRCKEQCHDCLDNPYPYPEPIRGCKRFCKDQYCSDEVACDPPDCVPGMPCNVNNVCTRTEMTVNGITYVKPKIGYPECKASEECPETASPPTRAGDGTEIKWCGQGTYPDGTCTTCESCDGSTCTACTFLPNGQVSIEVEQATCTPPPPIVKDDAPPFRNESCPWINIERQPCNPALPAPEFALCVLFNTGRLPDPARPYQAECPAVSIGNRFPKDCSECPMPDDLQNLINTDSRYSGFQRSSCNIPATRCSE